MAKRVDINKVKDDLFNTKNREGKVFVDKEINYPFCYKTKDEKNFFRYLEDGRYDHVCLNENMVTLSFGRRTNSINHLINEDQFYFKVLANLNIEISNEDFEWSIKRFDMEYKKYLEGADYIARDVEKIKKIKEAEKLNSIEENNSDIIQNDYEPGF